MREQPSIVKSAVPGGIDLDLVESRRFVDGSELLAQLLKSRGNPSSTAGSSRSVFSTPRICPEMRLRCLISQDSSVGIRATPQYSHNDFPPWPRDPTQTWPPINRMAACCISSFEIYYVYTFPYY